MRGSTILPSNRINARLIWREKRKANRKRSTACERWPKVSVQAGKLEQANQCAERRLPLRENSGNRPGELYPLLVKGLVATRQGDAARAETIFLDVQKDPKASAALIWGAQHALAQLHEQQGNRGGGE